MVTAGSRAVRECPAVWTLCLNAKGQCVGPWMMEGEVDIMRGRTFRSCTRNELRQIKVAEVEAMNVANAAEAGTGAV